MSSTRDQFLNRIKTSLSRPGLPEVSPEHPGSFRGYSYPTDAPVSQLIESFTRELEALSGHVHVLTESESVVPTVLQILEKHGAKQIITWDEASLGVPRLLDALIQAGIAIEDSAIPLDSAERRAKLAQLDGVLVGLTGAQGGLADTGSLVVLSGPGRGRLASLLPPVHIALLPAQKLYPSLPAFLAAHPNVTATGSNLVFITGPSRTADIELTLSMGVHGPKEIHVVITP
jgi:L-lactate dehydrogenase complex protein LldG